MPIPPFSARNAVTRSRVSDFPKSARIGLLHLTRDLVERRYVESWRAVIREMQRIARVPPEDFSNSERGEKEALLSFEALIAEVGWSKALDFSERLHGRLAKEVGHFDDSNELVVTTSLSEVQRFIAAEIELLFSEENLAFEYRDGTVYRKGRRHTIQQAEAAGMVLLDPRLSSAREHYTKALAFFRRASDPDFPNAVKEAVCAVEE